MVNHSCDVYKAVQTAGVSLFQIYVKSEAVEIKV